MAANDDLYPKMPPRRGVDGIKGCQWTVLGEIDLSNIGEGLVSGTAVLQIAGIDTLIRFVPIGNGICQFLSKV